MADEVLTPLFTRLVYRYGNEMGVKTPFPGTVLDLPLVLDLERLNVMPRIHNDTVRRIAKGAKAGNTDDMLTLAMMYSVGLGVPESEELSMSWSNFSIVATGPLSFKQAIKELRQHVADLPLSEFSYPAVIDKMFRRLCPRFQKVAIKEIPTKKNYMLSPLIAGVRLFAVYRVKRTETGSFCYLYDVRVGGVTGERLALELANKLNIPDYIGSHGSSGAKYKRLMTPDYYGRLEEYLQTPADYFVVAGTLAVPNSKKPLINKALPDIKSVSMLFDHFVSTVSEVRKESPELPEYLTISNSIDNAESFLKRLKSGSALNTLRSTYAQAKKELAIAKKKDDTGLADRARERLIALKAEGKSVKDGSAEAAAISSLDQAQKRLRELESENKEYKLIHHSKYPENLFQFLATDIYYGEKGNNLTLPVGKDVSRHLGTAGFSTIEGPMFEGHTVLHLDKSKSLSKVYKPTLKKFADKYPEFTVSGIVVRRAHIGSVKKAEEKPVYLVTSE